MSKLTPLQKRRKRVLAIVERHADKTIPALIDYHLDAFCRSVFDLPPLPKNAEPYVGWLTSEENSEAKPERTSQKGIDLIKEFEGFRNTAYLCPANVWTIGYGHTKTAKPGMCISTVQGEELLRKDVEKFENAVNTLVKVPLNQNQFDALVSFAYNVGVGAFGKSTLLRLLNQGEYQRAAKQLHRWVRGGGRKLPGLVRRRKAEYDLFVRNGRPLSGLRRWRKNLKKNGSIPKLEILLTQI